VTEQELERGARRRMAVIRHAQEVTGNVAKTCRYYGISRSAPLGIRTRNLRIKSPLLCR
jgi:hypothetical protein